MTVLFSDLALPSPLLKAVEELGFTAPTPIQAQAIPAALEGRDVVASANTGTGKTAAFVLPSLSRIAATPRAAGSWGPRVLVLTPTRELASQVLESVKALSKYHRIHTGTVLGGMPYRAQIEMLRRRADLVVATPGRLIDHLENGRIDLTCVEVLVLDEADRMLDMGFREAVEQIAAACPAERQTLLFTATLDRTAERLAATLTKDAVRVDVAGKAVVTTQVDQRWLRADGLDHKHKLLDRLLQDEAFQKGIVFTATKRDADRLADELSEKGLSAMPLHGDMQQRERNRVVQWLRDGRVNVIVATDVAARGIDISDLTHVINFDLPKVAEDYVHRIGRTGRAGATGTSYSLFTRTDRNLVRAIEMYTGQKPVLHTLPGLEPLPEPERGPRAPGGKPFGKGGYGKPFGGNRGGYGGGYGGGHGGGFRGGPRRDDRFAAGGDPAQGERPHGDRPHGDRPYSERPQGERKPWGERPARDGFQADRPRRPREEGVEPQGHGGGWSSDAGPVEWRERPHGHKAGPHKGHANRNEGHRGDRDFRAGPRRDDERRPFGGAQPLRRGKGTGV
ncbi:DEAD/DEAH box helicase [Oleisolibacter albus]|uniref:DEAD/DEAH box helicase n=1 Tax=Oleisolibacter albus TaxID=2171757 RepID=UPI001960AFF3|nr:DEAD/DEAH box helicase [Oleisolibacter albus]